MHVEYQAKGVDVSTALRTWLQRRLRKLERYDPGVRVEVVLRRNQEKGPVEADLIVHTHWGTIQSTRVQGYDERTALARALTKIDEQLRRFKERRTVGRRRATAEAVQAIEQQTMAAEALEPPVRRVPLPAVPLMTQEEAVQSLLDREETFVIFRDLENDEALTVVYRDKDDAIALVSSRS